MRMEKWKIKIDRSCRDLVRQFVDAIEKGIDDGLYVRGEKLPTIAEWTSLLGVSAFVPRRGIGILAKKGLVTVRRHTGSIVRGSSERQWKGKVAFITHSWGGSFHETRLAFEVQMAMEKAGYEFTHIYLPWTDKEDGNFESEVLLRHLANGIDFAVVNSANSKLCEMLASADVKYIVLNNYPRDLPKVCARLSWENSDYECARQLADYWRSGGVKSALIVDFKRMMSEKTYTRAFYDAGISISTINVPLLMHLDLLHELPQSALEAMKDYLDRNLPRKNLPDAIFFYDDFIAMGGLMALASCGLTDPGKIRIATISNRGFASYWFQPLTRIENDPIANGDIIAKFVLDFLNGRHPRAPKLPIRFIRGKT